MLHAKANNTMAINIKKIERWVGREDPVADSRNGQSSKNKLCNGA
jgi:hypothetical protein